ncbi:MAG TPA: hypothetical protein VIJ86_02445 [Acidimicrobiales bacterium]
MTRTKSLTLRVRMFVAGSVTAAALLVPLSVAVPQASAATSPFCTAVFSWAYHPVKPPTGLTLASYRKWVTVLLPYFEKMDATAPNAKTKEILGYLVTVLKNYGTATTFTKLAAYEKAHAAAFAADTKYLTAAITSCVTSGPITLP